MSSTAKNLYMTGAGFHKYLWGWNRLRGALILDRLTFKAHSLQRLHRIIAAVYVT
jgi:hypothetical protein